MFLYQAWIDRKWTVYNCCLFCKWWHSPTNLLKSWYFMLSTSMHFHICIHQKFFPRIGLSSQMRTLPNTNHLKVLFPPQMFSINLKWWFVHSMEFGWHSRKPSIPITEKQKLRMNWRVNDQSIALENISSLFWWRKYNAEPRIGEINVHSI